MLPFDGEIKLLILQSCCAAVDVRGAAAVMQSVPSRTLINAACAMHLTV